MAKSDLLVKRGAFGVNDSSAPTGQPTKVCLLVQDLSFILKKLVHPLGLITNLPNQSPLMSLFSFPLVYPKVHFFGQPAVSSGLANQLTRMPYSSVLCPPLSVSQKIRVT